MEKRWTYAIMEGKGRNEVWKVPGPGQSPVSLPLLSKGPGSRSVLKCILVVAKRSLTVFILSFFLFDTIFSFSDKVWKLNEKREEKNRREGEIAWKDRTGSTRITRFPYPYIDSFEDHSLERNFVDFFLLLTQKISLYS